MLSTGRGSRSLAALACRSTDQGKEPQTAPRPGLHHHAGAASFRPCKQNMALISTERNGLDPLGKLRLRTEGRTEGGNRLSAPWYRQPESCFSGDPQSHSPETLPRSKAPASTLHSPHGHQDRVRALPQEPACFSLSSSDFSPSMPSRCRLPIRQGSSVPFACQPLPCLLREHHPCLL